MRSKPRGNLLLRGCQSSCTIFPASLSITMTCTKRENRLRCWISRRYCDACPEYNFSFPGVLKNALDWVSRPPAPPLDGKPVAILGASAGALGTARAQYHLRQVLQYLNCFTVGKPEVFIGNAASKFDENGLLTDELTAKYISDLLIALQRMHRLVCSSTLESTTS